MKILFYIAIFSLFYIFIGYPLLLLILNKISNNKTVNLTKKQILPNVSVIVSAYNEEKHISKKIYSLLGQSYPKDKLEIIIGSDGSTDQTVSIIRKFQVEHKNIKLIESVENIGKCNMINKLINHVDGEIIVFSDAASILEKDCIKEIANSYGDGNVGGVAGNLVYKKINTSSTSDQQGLFSKYEKFIKKQESEYGSLVTASGALFSIRKELYLESGNASIPEDFLLPLNVNNENKRFVYCEKAIAFDEPTKDYKQEIKMRKRVSNGSFQAIFYAFQNLKRLHSLNKFSFSLISHKVLRNFSFFPLIVLFCTNLFLIGETLYNVSFGVQVFCYTLALVEVKFQINSRLTKLCGYFFLINYGCLIGFMDCIRGRNVDKWATER